jgi:hypothetical protein
MRDEGRLWVSAGVVSERGPRTENQDFAGVYLGTEIERAGRGMVAALADGVSGGKVDALPPNWRWPVCWTAISRKATRLASRPR